MKDQLIRLVIGLSLIKVIVHLYVNGVYGLHRDEYLYIDEGRHLSWGFMEVPPFTPFVAWFAEIIGNHPLIFRLFPTLAGAAIIFIVGKIIIELGGGKWAIIISGVSLIVSPSLLRSSTLFQPVIFNQLFWLLSSFWIFKIIKTSQPKYWYYLGVTIGLAFLNKYSILFYVLAIFIGLALSSERKILYKNHLWKAVIIALIIISPNLFWQWSHNWPVLAHMKELSENQLIYVNWSGFLSDQFLFHAISSLIWLGGLIALFRYVAYYRYRYAALAFIATILIIGGLSGKSYYTLGAFYILFPFGGIFFERILSKIWQKYLFTISIVVIAIPFLPLAAPFLPVDKLKTYCNYLDEEIGFNSFLYWEDGEKYALPQDYADMHGWEDLAIKVSAHYHQLPDSVKAKTIIYGGSYGHAGSLNFYRKKYKLPETYSRNGSYMLWGNENAQFENIIVIEEEYSGPWSDFNDFILLDSISNPYARDKGYTYFYSNPIRDPGIQWKASYVERRANFSRK